MKRTPIIATLVLLFSLFTGFAYAEPAVVNINTADVATLASLNGIGQSKAEAIVAYREANGPFQSPEELANVKGIGSRTVEKMWTGLPSSDPGRRGLSPPPTGFAPESYPEPEMSSGQAKRRGLS